LKIATNLPSQLLKGLRKDFASCFRLWVVNPKDLKYSNDACALGRLCIRCDWPGRRPAKDAQKFPSPHRRPRCFTSIVPIRTCDLEGVDVRFGSKADICSAKRHVRFTPESGHMRCSSRCPLWAKSGHSMPTMRMKKRDRLATVPFVDKEPISNYGWLFLTQRAALQPCDA